MEARREKVRTTTQDSTTTRRATVQKLTDFDLDNETLYIATVGKLSSTHFMS